MFQKQRSTTEFIGKSCRGAESESRLDEASERRDVSTRKRRLFRTGHLHGRHPELEKSLVEWIKARREERITVYGPDVQSKAQDCTKRFAEFIRNPFSSLS